MPSTSPLGTSLKGRIRNWLGTRRVWNFELALYAALFYTITAVSFDALRLNSFAAGWLPIWIGTYFEAIAIIASAVLLLPKKLWANPRRGATTNLVIAAGAGAIKNSTVFFWATAAGLETAHYDPFIRIVGGAVLALGILWSWVAMSASRVGHRALMIELRQKQATMLEYRDSVGEQVTAAEAELVAQTKRSLLPKLQELESRLAHNNDAQLLVSDLQDLIEQDVRPLSHAFQTAVEQLAAAPKPAKLDPEARRVFPTRFRIRENLPPMALLLFLIPLNAMTVYMLLGQGRVLPLTLTGLATVGLMLLWRAVWPRERLLRRTAGLIALSIGSATVGIPQAFLIFYMVGSANPQTPLLIASLVGQAVLGVWITSYLKILDDSRINLESQMMQVNDQLTHDLSMFNQALWLQKRRWGYLLHGTVQATLTAAIARLNSLKTSRLEGAQRQTEAGMLIELVRQDLRKITQVITNPPRNEIDLAQELTQLQQTWHGGLDIGVTVSERAKRAIDKSDNVRMALVEICREGATNAFRHGQATKLNIKIDRVIENEIALTLSNNGSAVEVANQVPGESKGLGLQMMDALTLEWHWEQRKTTALTVLSARLPIAIG